MDLNILRQKSEGFREMLNDWKAVPGTNGYDDHNPLVLLVRKDAFEIVLTVLLCVGYTVTVSYY